MDANIALMLIEALLIILAIAIYKAIRFISPSLHVTHYVAIDDSCNDDVVSISTISSSSSHILVAPPATKYDVFLSFRGEDTRDNFTNYLYEALCKANIQTFMDHKLHKGEQISPVLMRTIEESEISVIIFSKDYASSTWCLDELIKILECKDKYGRVVIPIFYNVNPSDVRKQSWNYEDAFTKLKQRFKHNPDKVQMWREALIQSASLSGWDSKNIRPESKLIQKIVKDILSKLNCTSSCYLEGLVGINHQIEKIEELLFDVRIVGIWGMGGIGKTTLAKVVFQKLKVQFESFSFVESVRERLASIGLDKLQEECFKELLKDKDIDIYNMKSTFVKRRLQQKKILLVLDDVDNIIKAEDLTKVCDWFGEGSRIIITSRDIQVLKNVSASRTYHVQQLDFHDALHLFSLNAFKQNEPFESYMELSEWVVDYCERNPLALVVLGCFLYDRRKEEWESALEKLKQAPHKDIFNVLKLSFDGLDNNQKNIFLDLAYFSRETQNLSLKFIRDFYDSSVYIEISILEDKSLISVDKFGDIKMHGLVREMALEIARQQLILDPRRPIRLWRHEDIYHFLMNNKGIETVRYISLDMCKIKRTTLTANAFQKMNDLRFLKFYKSDWRKPSNVYIFEDLDNLSEELRLFFWEEYPLPSVPLSFCAKNLMELEMPNSDLRQLWDGDQHLPNLQLINLIGSKKLIELPDLSQAPNIESILLNCCENLAQIHSSSVQGKLFDVWIHGCKELRHVNIGDNIIGRNLGLVAVNNFLNLNDFSFEKVTVKVFVSDDSNIFSGFQIKIVSVPFTEISECMGNIESAKLKLLTRSLASLLPFVSRLRWLDIPTELGNFKEHFEYLSDYTEKSYGRPWRAFNKLKAVARKRRGVLARLIHESATRERANKEEPSGVLAPLEFEEELMMEVECCSSNCNRLTRVPNSITRWSLLTQLSLQRSDIIGSAAWSIPDLSILETLAESDYTRLQPVIDLTISSDAATGLIRNYFLFHHSFSVLSSLDCIQFWEYSL